MSLLSDLINTIGLDKSFFYQLVLAVALYFISKKLFFQPYLESFEKRQKFTKGRLESSKNLEEKIEEKKSFYDQKAKFVHQEFQKIFNEIKQKAQASYQKESLKLQEEQKELMAKDREKLNQALKDQSAGLEKDLPFLVKLLVGKIKS